VDIFLEEAPKHLAALRLAVAHGIAETVETTAHSLKGELGYMGLPEISQRASEIEEGGRSKTLAVSPVSFRNSKRISMVCLLRYAARGRWSGTAYDNWASIRNGLMIQATRDLSPKPGPENGNPGSYSAPQP
jgi:hypothetical protein